MQTNDTRQKNPQEVSEENLRGEHVILSERHFKYFSLEQRRDTDTTNSVNLTQGLIIACYA
jgi:hypothetical protein